MSELGGIVADRIAREESPLETIGDLPLAGWFSDMVDGLWGDWPTNPVSQRTCGTNLDCETSYQSCVDSMAAGPPEFSGPCTMFETCCEGDRTAGRRVTGQERLDQAIYGGGSVGDLFGFGALPSWVKWAALGFGGLILLKVVTK